MSLSPSLPPPPELLVKFWGGDGASRPHLSQLSGVRGASAPSPLAPSGPPAPSARARAGWRRRGVISTRNLILKKLRQRNPIWRSRINQGL